MKKFIRFFAIILMIDGTYAQSNLPVCQNGDTLRRTTCLGSYTDSYGKYVGELKDGKANGQGTFTYSYTFGPSGNKYYVGQFKNNEYDGQGTFVFPTGEKYVGEFKNGMFSGLGTFYTPNGSVKNEGIWSENNLIRSVNLKQAQEEQKKASELAKDTELIKKILLENKSTNWSDRVTETVTTLLRLWLTDSTVISPEIPSPIFPAALKISQEKWESNKEFEDRVASSRIERQKEIERMQSNYKALVDKRNFEIKEITQKRNEKEKQLPARKKELINQTLNLINLKVSPKSATFDPERSILYVDASIEEGDIERFEYKNSPLQLRREAITSPVSLKLTPLFSVTDTGQFGIKAINIESGGVSASGISTQADVGSQTLRLATIDVPVISMPALTQQSALSVDSNQVEQILYRDENESLRKRLDEQRKTQELELANETRKAYAETVKLRAEAEISRNRQRELELQLASTSKTQINYGRTLNAHALVIGNGAYGGSSKLPNPINDAKAMSEKLRGLGFKVTESLDADRVKLVTSLSQFSKTAANADITLLFYAGHGVQISGTNYMLPIDLNLNDLSQAPLQGVSLNSVVEQYLPGKTKLVFLDACRDNPLMQVASRSVSRGLAPINVSEGTLIAYSTKDGQTAQDGTGKNSPFTAALLDHLSDPDDIAVVLRKVREDVLKNTGNKQQPWEYGSLTGGALVLSAIKPK